MSGPMPPADGGSGASPAVPPAEPITASRYAPSIPSRSVQPTAPAPAVATTTRWTENFFARRASKDRILDESKAVDTRRSR